MPIYQKFSGDTKSETWTARVAYWTGEIYTEKFTHSAEPPASYLVDLCEGTEYRGYRSETPDKSSFRAIKKSGLIKFTDHTVWRSKATYMTYGLPRKSNVFVARGAYTLNQEGNAFLNTTWHLFDLEADYTEMIGFPKDSGWIKDANWFAKIPQTDVDDAIESVKEEVVSGIDSSYDLLTEIMELKETISMLVDILRAIRHPLLTFLRMRKKMQEAGGTKKQLADLWLQYRYGIMPLIYSFHDIVATQKRVKQEYVTKRALRTVEKTISTLDGEGSQYYEVLRYSARVTAIGKMRNNDIESLRLADALSVNIIKTGWELIPFSFVVDWFVNVGNFLSAQIGSLYSFSTQKCFCYAVKETYTRETYYRDVNCVRTLETGPWWIERANDSVFPRMVRQAGQDNEADYLLRVETFEGYTRRVFKPKDIKLRVDVYINWKRALDALALTLGKTRSLKI